MNKRHYEHTLPNIRGSLSNTYDRRDARAIHTGDIPEEPFLIFPENQILTIPYPVPPEIFLLSI